jgi:phage-related holin
MADRRSLTMIGYIYGVMTAAVMLMACFVVADHITGRLSIESLPVQSAANTFASMH